MPASTSAASTAVWKNGSANASVITPATSRHRGEHGLRARG